MSTHRAASSSRRLRVAFVLPAYEPAWALGGIVACTSSLCREMASLGHDISVYTIDTDGAGRCLGVPRGVPVDVGGVQTWYFPSMLGANSVFHSRPLVHHLDRTVASFDVVYCSATWQWLGVETARICSRHSVPLVIGPHGSLERLHLEHHAGRKRLFWTLALRSEVARATALHFVTQHERVQSEPLVGAKPFFVVPNPVDLSRLAVAPGMRSSMRGELNLGDDDLVAIAVGRPDPIKRTDLVIRALAIEPQAKLMIVGPTSGATAASWRRLSSVLGVSERVVWTGMLKGTVLSAAYAAADLLVLPSVDENFGMVVVEALACGVPVLVTPQVGVWPSIEQADVGQSVCASPPAIAAVLGDVLTNRDKWICRGKRGPSVAQAFEPRRVATHMARELADLL